MFNLFLSQLLSIIYRYFDIISKVKHFLCNILCNHSFKIYLTYAMIWSIFETKFNLLF